METEPMTTQTPNMTMVARNWRDLIRPKGISIDTESATDFYAKFTCEPLERGFGITEFQTVGNMITEVLDGLAKNGDEGNSAVEADVKKRAVKLCERFPIYR